MSGAPGYDAGGQATDYYQWSTNSGGWYHVQNNYAGNGTVNYIQGFLGATGTNAYTHALYHNWDGKGRPYGIWDATTSTAIWPGSNYNASDQPLGVPGIYGGAAVMAENFTYDPNTNRMLTWSANGVVNGVATNVQTGTLSWNTNGTLYQLKLTDTYNSVNNTTCTYVNDDLGRPSKDSCDKGWLQNIRYDSYGSVVKQGNSSLNIDQPYDYTGKNNHYSTAVTGITYDYMGNVTKDFSGNTYTYDAEGRPITVNGVTTVFDALNRAVEQSRSGVTTQIVYAPTGEKFSFMNGQALKSYMLPMVAGLQVVYNPSGLQYFRQVDWLGNGRFATNSSGGVYYDASYGPWGEMISETGTNDRMFTGQTQDTTGGTFDFMFRQHAPVEGRWLVPDPAGLAAVDITNPQSWNRYAYALNNPLSNIDPSGLECVWDDGSFDSADDPQTGSANGCSGQGGTWVDPNLFENSMLTNGQWNSNYGDWSSSPSSYLAQNWTLASGTAYGGEWAAGQEVDEAVNEFYGNGAKPTIVYPPNDPFTLSFRNSMGMQGILAGIKANCSATSGRVPVGTGEAFVNTMIDGPFLQSPDGRVSGYYTPEAQMGAFNSTYTRSGGVVDITVTNPITLNSLALHMTAPFRNPESH